MTDIPEKDGTFADGVRQAFAVGDEYADVLDDDEKRLLMEIAENIHKRKMTSVAIPYILFHTPLNLVGANLIQMGELAFKLGPIETYLKKFLGRSYTHELLVRTLEKRCAVEELVGYLEDLLDNDTGDESS